MKIVNTTEDCLGSTCRPETDRRRRLQRDKSAESAVTSHDQRTPPTLCAVQLHDRNQRSTKRAFKGEANGMKAGIRCCGKEACNEGMETQVCAEMSHDCGRIEIEKDVCANG